MIIAIPSVTRYINESRRNAYVVTAKEYVLGVRNKVNSSELAFFDTDTTYYVPNKCVELESGGDSPFGKFIDGETYVVVTYDGDGYNYYWTSRDESNMGIYLTYEGLLDTDKVQSDIEMIRTDIGVGTRPKIKVLGNSCKVEDAIDKIAIANIGEKGYVDEVFLTDMIGMHKEEILHGAYPRVRGNLLSVTIADNGEVKRADTSTEWYSYENKRWANAVILKDESVKYEKGEAIPESNIESYFVWVPRYKYKLWNVNNTSNTGVDPSKAHEIEIVFESAGTTPSNGTSNGEWLTHPAFTSFGVNGMWVGKFETGYDGATSVGGANKNTVEPEKVIVKPNVFSWRYIQIANAFTTSYNYQRSLDSHMMKNTEWGAVAYLSHSKYGQGNKSVRINNNSNYRTGYAAVREPTVNRSDYKDYGTAAGLTQPWNTTTGYQASTTGNITGVYDMVGGAYEYVMGAQVDSKGLPLSGLNNSWNSGFNGTLSSGGNVTNGTPLPEKKYYDAYPVNSNGNKDKRILGDATGEMGPFRGSVNSWHGDNAWFVDSSNPWFLRGGRFGHGSDAGMFYFSYNDVAPANSSASFRLVLAF